MKYFLELVAQDIIAKAQYSNNLSRLVLVFPNKRASLFFNRHLESLLKGKAIWAPQYMTISELFKSFSHKTLADDIEVICRLYNIYVCKTHSKESLDHFYSWGERLLADFDDIDKNLSLEHDAQKVFCNISDLKKLEDDGYITPEQRAELYAFFHKHVKGDSGIHAKFFEVWDHLYDIYTTLNDELSAKGEAYEGALYRDVVKELKQGAIKCPKEVKQYVFVGLNVLDYVEHELLTWLNQQQKARFYWDYDNFYVSEHNQYEAGIFIREDLREFPNELPAEHFNNLSQPKEEFEIVQAPGENIQAFSVADWLQLSRGHLDLQNQPRTAIILCNEELTEPVLHALPAIVGENKDGTDTTELKVNITKGFQLTHTPVYTLIDQLLNIAEHSQRKRSQKHLLQIIQFVIERAARNLLQSNEQEKTDASNKHQFISLLYTEAYYKVHTTLERFIVLLRNKTLQVTTFTLHRLIKQVLSKLSIPFHGDPIDGIQVMGLLESRNLDFDNVLLLSANEGNIPKLESENSFIPYTLRKAFNLTCSEKKNAVYAYYFYRLLQRPSKVRILYNSTTDIATAEPSRFLQQIVVSKIYDNIHHETLVDAPQREALSEDPIKKPHNLFDILNPLGRNGERRMLSPSSLNAYIECPLKFYYQKVKKLRLPTPAPDDIKANSFGNIFHTSAELLYKEICGYNKEKNKYNTPIISKSDLESWLSSSKEIKLRQFIFQAYKKEGLLPNALVTEIVLTYLHNLLKFDSKFEFLKILTLEEPHGTKIDVMVNGVKREFAVGGFVDRLDIATLPNENPTVRIVDYKTSSQEQTAKDVEELFNTDGKAHPGYLFQTLLYALAVKEKFTEINQFSSVLFYPHFSTKENYDPRIIIGKSDNKNIQEQIFKDFEGKLKHLIEDLLNPSIPFIATPSKDSCKCCDFYRLCGQAIKENI